MSVFVSHSASEEARHVLRTLTQHGLQMYTEQAKQARETAPS